MAGVRRSDNSDEAAAFFASQTRLQRKRAQAALRDGARNSGADKPLPRHQALAALSIADELLADLAPTRQGWGRRTQLEAVRGAIADAKAEGSTSTALRAALTASGQLLRDFAGTHLMTLTCPLKGTSYRKRVGSARMAIDCALVRLLAGRGPESRLR